MKKGRVQISFLSEVGWAVILSIALPLQAAEWGGLEGKFLTWGAGARALGLGNAFTAVANDASATYWNPAGLAGIQRSEFMGLHAILWEGVTYDFATIAFPTLVHGTFGFHAVALAVGGAERRDVNNLILSDSFGELKIAAGPSWALPITSWLSSGVTIKYIGRWVDNIQSGFLTGDLGVLLTLPYQISVAATGKHLFFLRQGPTADLLPWEGRIGVAWRALENALLMSIDIEQDGRFHVGAEVSTFSPFVLRAGTQRLESLVGAGVRFQDVNLDYTAGIHQEFGLSHRVSFSLEFGEPVPAARLKYAEQRFNEAYALYKSSQETTPPPQPSPTSGEGKKGGPQQNHKEECLRLLEEALALDPGNGAAGYLKDKLFNAR